MTRLQWILMRLIDKLDLLSILVMLLMLLMVGFSYLFLFPANEQLLRLEQQPKPATTRVQKFDDNQYKVDLFEQMPSESTLTENLRAFYELVEDYDLAIDEIVFRDEKKQNEDDIIRYQISFVVEDSYPQIKSFIVDVMAELPYLALDHVSFDRENISYETVSAQLSFTLFMVAS